MDKTLEVLLKEFVFNCNKLIEANELAKKYVLICDDLKRRIDSLTPMA